MKATRAEDEDGYGRPRKRPRRADGWEGESDEDGRAEAEKVSTTCARRVAASQPPP
jgi:hypothetical protein